MTDLFRFLKWRLWLELISKLLKARSWDNSSSQAPCKAVQIKFKAHSLGQSRLTLQLMPLLKCTFSWDRVITLHTLGTLTVSTSLWCLTLTTKFIQNLRQSPEETRSSCKFRTTSLMVTLLASRLSQRRATTLELTTRLPLFLTLRALTALNWSNEINKSYNHKPNYYN